MTSAAYVPPCIAPWATPGVGLVRLPRLHRGVADDEDLRVAGDRQVGLDDDPPGAIGRGAGRGRHGARELDAWDAGGPQDGPRRDRLLGPVGPGDPDALLVEVDDPGPGPDLDAQALQLPLRRRASGPAGRAAGSGPSPRPG